ncbi:uncharacterized protein LOC112208361 [Pan troglodytes]|uniref:uncharacterized protein LOC112208361 n=1 Tax=Pan troglodytes TaxID=9598 RepID=UPI003013369C
MICLIHVVKKPQQAFIKWPISLPGALWPMNLLLKLWDVDESPTHFPIFYTSRKQEGGAAEDPRNAAPGVTMQMKKGGALIFGQPGNWDVFHAGKKSGRSKPWLAMCTSFHAIPTVAVLPGLYKKNQFSHFMILQLNGMDMEENNLASRQAQSQTYTEAGRRCTPLRYVSHPARHMQPEPGHRLGVPCVLSSYLFSLVPTFLPEFLIHGLLPGSLPLGARGSHRAQRRRPLAPGTIRGMI